MKPLTATAQGQSLVASNTAFALNFYQQIATNEGNLFFSPYSISTCLAMIYAGARGETETQMAQVLGFSTNQNEFASLYGQLLTDLDSDQESPPATLQLNIADALWTQEGLPFLSSFLEIASNQYQANVNQTDFATNAEGSREAINSWVAQETQNKIEDLLPPGSITPGTRLVLANAIYFMGNWTQSFASSNTTIQPFYFSGDSEVAVPMMYRAAPSEVDPGTNFNYMEGSNFQALELPYADGQVVMDILLPTQVDGWRQLEQQISPAFLSNVLAKMLLTEVEIHLPRFTFEYSFNLVAPLVAMGMVDAFDPGGADFSGIDGASDLYISGAYHKAWVEVNESGTVAAAATAVTTVTSTVPPPPPVFRADHPFLFFIRDVGTGSLLFAGRVVFPSQAGGVLTPTPMLSMAHSANGLKISWPVVLTGWTLRQNGDLNTTNWTACTGASTDGTNNFVTITATTGSMFYQLGQ